MRYRISTIGLSLVLVVALMITAATFAMANDIDTDELCEECSEYPIMRPDQETIDKWIEGLNALRLAPIEKSELNILRAATLSQDTQTKNMLSWVPYIVGDRDQVDCGNCWVWASTGCMEIAHLVENDVNERLSIQFVNSAYGGGGITDYACCGGWMGDFASFYSMAGYAIPWDNTNANWQDGNTTCDDGTSVNIVDIGQSPRYNISYIEAFRIGTHEEGVDQADAIASIKYFLDRNYGVYFSFKLPNSTAWNQFFNFWNNDPDTAIWNNFHCGADYNHDPGEGGGHGVLCVGYNDEEGTANDYWIMLNSWGATPGRPDGTFRVAMDINYHCELDGMSGRFDDYSLNWLILEVDFPNHAPKADINGPYTDGEGIEILFDASGSSDQDGDVLEYAWDFDNDGNWDTGWSPDPTITHKWCDDYEGIVNLIVKERFTDEQLTDTDWTTVTVNNVAPTVVAGPEQTVNEGDTVSFAGSFTDPGTCDTHTIEWDFGDGNTASGTLTPTYVYGDDGVFTVTLMVTDDDGGVGTDELTVTVNNVAPTIEYDKMEQPNWQFILPIVHTLDFEATATDPGSDDLTFTWEWGDTTSDVTIYYNDGVGPDPYPSPEVNPMNITDLVSHVYSNPGDYTATLTVTDDDGGVDSFLQSIHVADVEEALDITNTYIQELPDSAFKNENNADNRKKSLDNKFFAIDQMLANESYSAMIQALRNDIRDKADGSVDGKPGDDWIIDPAVQQEICQKIDDITAYLETFL